MQEGMPVGPGLLNQERQIAKPAPSPALGFNPRFPAAQEKLGKKSFGAKPAAQTDVNHRFGTVAWR
jgi:hypothetical protein